MVESGMEAGTIAGLSLREDTKASARKAKSPNGFRRGKMPGVGKLPTLLTVRLAFTGAEAGRQTGAAGQGFCAEGQQPGME
jgi:hypothetical protein